MAIEYGKRRIKDKLELKIQENPKDLFYGIIKKDDRIDVSICNPPFHASEKAANMLNENKHML